MWQVYLSGYKLLRVRIDDPEERRAFGKGSRIHEMEDDFNLMLYCKLSNQLYISAGLSVLGCVSFTVPN
jgi:hypothetical protein